MVWHAPASAGQGPDTPTPLTTKRAWASGLAQASGQGMPALQEKARDAGKVRIIVRLKSPGVPEAGLSSSKVKQQRATLRSTQDRVLGALGQPDKPGVQRFTVTPALAMEATADELDQLIQNPDVDEVVEDRLNRPMLYDSSPLIGATDAWASGYTGAGQVVAVLDSGIYKSHPFLVGKVISEACYSTNSSGSGWTSVSLCPGQVASSTASNSGLNCNTATWGSECSHGTHVAGIAAGKNGNSSHGVMSGVGKEANLIAIQVFSGITEAGQTSIQAWDSDIVAALEQVYALRSSFNIAAVNLSVGGGYYTSPCNTDVRKPIIDNLRAAGIATVIAAGNDGWNGATNAPGCISTAITTGSSTKTNQEADYSNMAPWVDLIAPGSDICSSTVGATADCGSGYSAWNGTSMATPQVAGTWAVMKSKKPTATVDEIEAALKATGTPIATYLGAWPRITLVPALAQLTDPSYLLSVSKTGSGTGTVTSSPAGISCGLTCSASFTANATVTLTATPTTGSTLAGWTGCTSTSGTTCTVSLTTARTVTASFSTSGPTLSVSTSGSGTVTSNPAGISCGSTCSAPYTRGTTVNLTATPAAGFAFAGWSGACAGMQTCAPVMTENRSVLARFNPAISLSGQLSGDITVPAGTTTYTNVAYDTTGTPNTLNFLVGMGSTSVQITYPDFFNDTVNSKHELIGSIKVQGYAREYVATSYYGMVTLANKTSGQIIQFQVTRPAPGPNSSGINVEFLDGTIGFTSHLTPPLPELPNGRWTLWMTKGGIGTAEWGTVPAVQFTVDAAIDLLQAYANGALNTEVTSANVNWTS